MNVLISRGSVQIIANFTRENLAEREAEIANLFLDTDGERQSSVRCRIGQRGLRAKKTCALPSMLSLMKMVTLGKTR